MTKHLKNIFAKTQNIFLIFSSIIILQAISIYYENVCHGGFISSKKCNIIKNSFITKPSKFLYNTLNDLNDVFKNDLSTSGRIVKKLYETQNRFNSIDKRFSFYYKKGSRDDAGYLLLSAGDPNKDGAPLVELWDMNNQKLVHKWKFDMRKILATGKSKRSHNSVVFKHPLLLEDGSLIVNSGANVHAITKFSPNGEIINFNDKYQFHHSIEADLQGRIYVPMRKERGNLKTEGFAILDKNLNILETYFLTDIFKKAGLLDSINKGIDPYHLNDIQPLNNPKKTQYVLISLNTPSSVIAYDLFNKRIVWILDGLTSKQHDPDFLNKDGTEIAIFDNNTIIYNGKGSVNNNLFLTIKNLPPLNKKEINKPIIFNNSKHNKSMSELKVITNDFSFLSKKLIPKTLTDGLSEILYKNDSIFVEETNYGRLIEIDFKENKLLWQYINKNNSNRYYMMGWSRRIGEISDSTIDKLTVKN